MFEVQPHMLDKTSVRRPRSLPSPTLCISKRGLVGVPWGTEATPTCAFAHARWRTAPWGRVLARSPPLTRLYKGAVPRAPGQWELDHRAGSCCARCDPRGKRMNGTRNWCTLVDVHPEGQTEVQTRPRRLPGSEFSVCAPRAPRGQCADITWCGAPSRRLLLFPPAPRRAARLRGSGGRRVF